MDKNVIIARVGVCVSRDEQGKYGSRLPIAAQLFAEIDIGARLSVGMPTIVGPMERRGLSAIWKDPPGLPADFEQRRQLLENYENYRVQREDVEDIINSVLGRDPEQIRPYSLSWDPLIELLDREGITVTEDELIATPFVFEFSDELLAELAPEPDNES